MHGRCADALFSDAEFLEIIREASRAPSVHNIQPARFRQASPGVIEVHADPSRTLPVADPSGRDVRTSLGAASEGVRLALAERGFTIAWIAPAQKSGNSLAATIAFAEGGAKDPLSRFVARRSTWRGRFEPVAAAVLDRLQGRLTPPESSLVRDPDAKAVVAKLMGPKGVGVTLENAYWRETWRWLRLSPAHPRWNRDGLNATSLRLSSIESACARLFMRPSVFGALKAIGAAQAFASEAAQVKSASAFVVLLAAETEDPFDSGRRLYRNWLEVTALGLSACPMSILADSPEHHAALRVLWSVPATHRIVNVFRVGRVPAQYAATLAPRIPAEELVMQ